VDAGERNRRVTIQERQVTHADGAGGSLVSWTPFATVWANILPGSGREFWEQKKLTPSLSHLVNIRYLPGVTPAMRIVYGQRVLAITSVRDVGERAIEQELACEEVGPALLSGVALPPGAVDGLLPIGTVVSKVQLLDQPYIVPPLDSPTSTQNFSNDLRFPIQVGETWAVDATMNIKGAAGYIDGFVVGVAFGVHTALDAVWESFVGPSSAVATLAESVNKITGNSSRVFGTFDMSASNHHASVRVVGTESRPTTPVLCMMRFQPMVRADGNITLLQGSTMVARKIA
jgi:SPP1 family predicted phage head-tail adaptor